MMRREEISHHQKDKLVSFGSDIHIHYNLNAISTEKAKQEISTLRKNWSIALATHANFSFILSEKRTTSTKSRKYLETKVPCWLSRLFPGAFRKILTFLNWLQRHQWRTA